MNLGVPYELWFKIALYCNGSIRSLALVCKETVPLIYDECLFKQLVNCESIPEWTFKEMYVEIHKRYPLLMWAPCLADGKFDSLEENLNIGYEKKAYLYDVNYRCKNRTTRFQPMRRIVIRIEDGLCLWSQSREEYVLVLSK